MELTNVPIKTTTITFIADSEQQALDIIEYHKNHQNDEGYTLTKYKTDYKSKKDRKTHEIIEEHWAVTVTKEYEVI